MACRNRSDSLRLPVVSVYVTFRHRPMGSLCSKQGTHSGAHYSLEPTAHRQALSAGVQRPSDPRAAAAAAAEQRLKAVSRATATVRTTLTICPGTVKRYQYL